MGIRQGLITEDDIIWTLMIGLPPHSESPAGVALHSGNGVSRGQSGEDYASSAHMG